MAWLDALKVDDSVVVQTRGVSPYLYVGKVVKVTKTKVEVSYIRPNYSSSFSKKDGTSPRAGKLSTPDLLMELTPEIQESLDFQRTCETLYQWEADFGANL